MLIDTVEHRPRLADMYWGLIRNGCNPNAAMCVAKLKLAAEVGGRLHVQNSLVNQAQAISLLAAFELSRSTSGDEASTSSSVAALMNHLERADADTGRVQTPVLDQSTEAPDVAEPESPSDEFATALSA